MKQGRRAPQRPRAGLTLIEVVVSVALVAILTGVTIPAVRGRMRNASASAIVSELSTLEEALRGYRQDVGRMPPKLSYLYALPASPSDWCSPTKRALPAALKAKWHGPYVNRPISGDYVLVDNDTVLNSISYTSVAIVSGGTLQNLGQLQIKGVDTSTVQIADAQIDGSINGTLGRLQWSGTTSQTLVYYFVITPSDAC